MSTRSCTTHATHGAISRHNPRGGGSAAPTCNTESTANGPKTTRLEGVGWDARPYPPAE